jgi:hypothetical protein
MRVATIISFKFPPHYSSQSSASIICVLYGDIKQPTDLITNNIIVSNAREWVTRTLFGLKIGQTCFEDALCLPVPRTSNVYSVQMSASFRNVIRKVTTRQNVAGRDVVHKNSFFSQCRTFNAISFVPIRNVPPSLRRFQH